MNRPLAALSLGLAVLATACLGKVSVGTLSGDLDAGVPRPPIQLVPDAGSAPDSGQEADAGDAGHPGVDAGAVDAGPRWPVYDAGVLGDGDFTIGPVYKDAPELTVPPKTPRGKVYPFTMDSHASPLYPGLTGAYTRRAWVYVPSQYVDGDAAPFMVVQDGEGYVGNVTAALDTLIAAKKLPALVTLFINPGPGDGQGSERGLEYDTVSDRYTRFIETEALPAMLTLPALLADRPMIRLTDNPEGRGAMGGSSGGAAAFTMGWFHPELYRRVLTYSGTFVNQHPDTDYPHSAWEYHEHLIAETPAKPLRVFLECGDHDNNLDARFGDGMHNWTTANKAMSKALAAQGYPERFLFALDAGHVDGHVVRQTLPEALLWVWRGYPLK